MAKNIAFFSPRFTTLRPHSRKTGAAFETSFFRHVSLRSGRGPGKKVRPSKGYIAAVLRCRCFSVSLAAWHPYAEYLSPFHAPFLKQTDIKHPTVVKKQVKFILLKLFGYGTQGIFKFSI